MWDIRNIIPGCYECNMANGGHHAKWHVEQLAKSGSKPAQKLVRSRGWLAVMLIQGEWQEQIFTRESLGYPTLKGKGTLEFLPSIVEYSQS